MSFGRKTSYFDLDHALNTRIKLSSSFASIDMPTGFRENIQLYPHQATVVRALVDVEDRRVLQVKTDTYGHLTNSDIMVETSAMVLSEPFGSGKTLEILALILVRPVPRAFPIHMNSITINSVNTNQYAYRGNTNTDEKFSHEIVRRFTGPDALIRPNLIVVGSGVLVQWEQAIKEFTTLKLFTIGDYYKLQKFYNMYLDGKAKAYDIILLKNGNVTGTFVLPGEDPSQICDHRSLISVVSKITKNACWSRVVYDDFDTINIPSGSNAINALFTIYVSATTKSSTPIVRTNTLTYVSVLDAIRSRQTPLNLVTTDSVLFTNFNICNTSEYVEASTKIPIIDGFRYVYANPDDNYIRLLGVMGEDDANNIMEMLNGDAIGTAADALGIKTSSVADIFQRMLDKKYENFLYDQDVLEILEKFDAYVETLNEHLNGKKHTGTELDTMRAMICKKQMPKPAYTSIELERLIDDLTIEFRHAKEHDGLAINRVIDNIKEGECQICRLPLEDFDTFIVRCCGLIVCDVCGIKGNQIKLRYDYKLKGETISGSCANCKATVYPQTDLIFVDRDFDMEALLKAKGDEKPDAPIEEVVVEEVGDSTEKEPEIKNPKLKALRDIVRGDTPEAAEKISINIKHLLAGRINSPPSADTERKVLVFANFNETLNLVEDFLVEQKITFLRLGGTFQEKATTVKRFKTYGQVLLINSQHHCAGLNLQFASDLVFFHKIADKNIESQVAGRIQRIGRTNNARIHYLCYKNEKNRV